MLAKDWIATMAHQRRKEIAAATAIRLHSIVWAYS